MDTIKVDGKEVPLIHAKTRTIIKHKKTGEQYCYRGRVES